MLSLLRVAADKLASQPWSPRRWRSRAAAARLAGRLRGDQLTYLNVSALLDLYDAVKDVEDRDVPGQIVEAGCALGGSAILLAWTKSQQRPLRVYDVFGLIPPPSSVDGQDAQQRYQVIRTGQSEGLGGDVYYGYQSDLLRRVQDNFARYSLPARQNRVELVQGLFENTMRIDQPVALAHLDCDWYASVRTCLERLTPRLAVGGRLVIDDYHHYSGCRKAVDEYFASQSGQFEFVQRSRLHIVRRAAAVAREAA